MIGGLTPFLVPAIIYGIGALGLALIYRYLRFPDFTVIGSMINGGICAIYCSNRVGSALGIASGFLVGLLLGGCTGFLTTKFKIKPVLAGIITFTGSLTLANLLADGGTIDLMRKPKSFLASIFSASDLVLLISCALLLCFLFALLSKTKFGVLVLAMTAEPRFLKFRHRYRNQTFITVVAIGNGIVSFAGGLYAIKDKSASVLSHFDFLTLSLGGIFAANAVAVLAHKWVGDYVVSGGGPENSGNTSSETILRRLPKLSSVTSENSTYLFLLLVTYVAGCFFFVMLSRAVYAKIFFSVDSAYQHIVVATLLTFCVWWAGTEDD